VRSNGAVTTVLEVERARELARAALASLERNRRRIDDLNVYPVPDGDTGTNMTLTLRATVEQLESTRATDLATIARELTRAALLGARGNSGVIFSQILRGFAEVIAEADALDSPTLAHAFRNASDSAYRAVREPVEGTMLTVIREMADEAEQRTDEPPRLLLAAVVRRGADAVERTPELLDVLRKAGVVDAGGAGLLEIVRGIAAGLAGDPLPEAPPAEELSLAAVHQEQSRYRYCTVFVVEGADLDRELVADKIAPLGDSLLVVGDDSALKVHVHTDDPGAALSFGATLGMLEGIEIANMHRQTEQREERLLRDVADVTAASDVVAVVAGDGNRALFESLGAAQIVTGGQSMNPAAADLVAAIEDARADEVIVLPNNSNVILAAEQAQSLVSKPVRVVPTTSIPAGLAALVAFDPERGADENVRAMEETLAGVVTGAVTVASKDADVNGLVIKRGEFLALAEGEPIASVPTFAAAAEAVLRHLLAQPRDVVTLLTGESEPDVEPLVEGLRAEHPELELEVHEGGQPHYPLLVSAE
jgi:DAK2 domain fusion protein YloV